MEKRIANIMIHAAGGTAAKGSNNYKISLPSSWIKELGITENNRQVELSFDGTTICISKKLSVDDFIRINKTRNHALIQMLFYDGDLLCSRIIADYTQKAVCTENYVDDCIRTAFGNDPAPTWAAYETFLEDRCIPSSRAGLREYLDAIGVDHYDPLEIIRKTAGRMAEDNQWLKVEVLV